MTLSLERGSSLISSLLPKALIERLEGNNVRGMELHAATGLVVKVVLGTVTALEQKNYKQFDANPGDGGCQIRALELYRLAEIDLSEECRFLERQATKVRNAINRQKSSQRTSGNIFDTERSVYPSAEFKLFQEMKIEVSSDMEYLMHCYLSRKLTAVSKITAEGVVLEKTDNGLLSKLEPKISELEASIRNKIVEEHQKTLSILSMEKIRVAATQISSLPEEEKELTMKMLCAENSHLFTPDAKYEPKEFGCLFYEIKTLMARLKEQRALIALKSIVPQGSQPFHLFLQSKGEEFKLLDDGAVTSLAPTTALVLFEAVVLVEKEEAARRLMEEGFTTTILMESARVAPYERGSLLSDVKVDRAREEIQSYRDCDGERLIKLDHIYLNTLGAECRK